MRGEVGRRGRLESQNLFTGLVWFFRLRVFQCFLPHSLRIVLVFSEFLSLGRLRLCASMFRFLVAICCYLNSISYSSSFARSPPPLPTNIGMAPTSMDKVCRRLYVRPHRNFGNHIVRQESARAPGTTTMHSCTYCGPPFGNKVACTLKMVIASILGGGAVESSDGHRVSSGWLGEVFRR